MSKKIFVNLPIKNLKKSMEFFTKLGYTFNPQFTDEKAACMIISEDIYAMLVVEEFYKTFTDKPIADATKTNEVIIALTAESKEQVDEMVNKALATGAKPSKDKSDLGFMYSWSFQDLDNHIWEMFWMDPSYLQK